MRAVRPPPACLQLTRVLWWCVRACRDDAVAVNPADSRCVVYESVDAAHRLWIKGQHFSVVRLMGPDYDSQDHWRHAALAINRHGMAAAMAVLPGRLVRMRTRSTLARGRRGACGLLAAPQAFAVGHPPPARQRQWPRGAHCAARHALHGLPVCCGALLARRDDRERPAGDGV